MKLIQVNSLLKLCNELKDMPMNVLLAYKFAKLKSKLTDEDQFYTSKLQSIIGQYGEVDDEGKFIFTNNGNSIKIKEGLTEECQAEIDILNAIDVELPDIHFTLQELDGLNLTINQMELLIDFIEE